LETTAETPKAEKKKLYSQSGIENRIIEWVKWGKEKKEAKRTLNKKRGEER